MAAKPSKLDAERQKRVVDAILAGAPQAVAAAHGGIAESTHHAWCARGRAAQEAAESGRPVPEADGPYRDYLTAVEHARREWELRQIALIQRAAQGQPWEKRKTVTVTMPDGSVKTTTTVDTGVTYYWAAAAWLLERRLPQQYASLHRAEITGPEGAPIALSLDELEASATAKIDELAERHARRAG